MPLMCYQGLFASDHRSREIFFKSFFFFSNSHVIQHIHNRAGRIARNIAGAEALAVARRPEVASREKNPAAAGIRRFFPLSNESKIDIEHAPAPRGASAWPEDHHQNVKNVHHSSIFIYFSFIFIYMLYIQIKFRYNVTPSLQRKFYFIITWTT